MRGVAGNDSSGAQLVAAKLKARQQQEANMKALTLTLLVTMSGCVASNPARWANKHPDWNPPQGIEYAIAQCEVKAQETSGYDWADATLKKGKAKAACMKAYGYE